MHGRSTRPAVGAGVALRSPRPPLSARARARASFTAGDLLLSGTCGSRTGDDAGVRGASFSFICFGGASALSRRRKRLAARPALAASSGRKSLLSPFPLPLPLAACAGAGGALCGGVRSAGAELSASAGSGSGARLGARGGVKGAGAR